MNLPYSNKVVGKKLNTNDQVLIECPPNKELVIKSISFANITTGDVVIDAKFRDFSEANEEYYLANGVSVYNDTVFELVSNLIILEENDALLVKANDIDTCHVVISYIEISK